MKRLVFALVSIFFVLGTIIVISYAWFVNSDFQEPEVTGYSTAAYFASGDGSEEKPFEITNARHMYNLAWLQYLGRFNQTNSNDSTQLKQQYHFKITSASIDMSAYSLPPIGTTLYPFVGVLQGNGCVIRNLNTSNDFNNDLPNHPLSVTVLENCEIIGLFGVIGNYKDKYANISSTKAKVTNLYIDNQTVTSCSKGTLIGMLAGYVAGGGEVSSVGIHYSSLKMTAAGVTKYGDFNDISTYSLVGAYDEAKVSWEDKPIDNGGTGGDALAYGGSFDVQKLMTRIEKILINKNNYTSPLLPTIDTSNENPTVGENQVLPLTIVDELSVYDGDGAYETVSSENIGYFCGNQNKLYDHDITFSELVRKDEQGNVLSADTAETFSNKILYSWATDTTPRTFFTRTGGNGTATTENIREMSESEIKALPLGIQNLLGNVGETKNYNTIRLQQRFEGTVGANDGPKQYQKSNIYYYGTKYDQVYLPNNGIWFRPKVAGKIRFVVYTASDGKQFSLYKCSRTNLGTDTIGASNVVGLNSSDMPLNILVYFEYDVTQTEIDSGVEFIIANDNKSSGAYFLYLDIGTNGGAGDEEGGTESQITGIITGVDFVLNTSTTEGVYSYSSLNDNSSGVAFVINGTSTTQVVYYFRRNKYGTVDIVLYYVDPKNNGLTLRGYGTGKNDVALDSLCLNYTGSLSSDEKIALAKSRFSQLSSANIVYDSDSLSLINDASTIWNLLSSKEKTSSGLSESTLTTAKTTYNNAGKTAIEEKIAELPSVETLTTANYENYEKQILETKDYYESASNEIKALVSSESVSTLTAVYEKYIEVLPTYTVTYVYNDGTTVDSKESVKKTFTATKPTVDETSYYLLGWYKDEELTTEFDFTTPITDNITLYAKRLQIYTITLNAGSYNYNNGYFESYNWSNTITVKTNRKGKISLTDAEIPKVNGGTFYGWYLDENYTFEYSSDTAFTKNTTLYAQYGIMYTVTFIDSSDSSTIATVQCKQGYSVEEPKVKKYGYVIEGWYTDSSCSNEYDITTQVSNNLTLYAKWVRDESISEITVTFNSNGGFEVSSQTIFEGQTAIEPTEPTKDGYVFGGWYSDETLTNEFDFGTKLEEDTALYAKWLSQYTITFNSNGGSEVSSQTVIEGQTATKPTTPTKTDYVFDGWYIDETLVIKYDFSSTITSNMILYAKWNETTGYNYYNTTFINDSNFTYTNCTDGSSTASVNNPMIIISNFQISSLKTINISITSADKVTTAYNVYYSTDGSIWTNITTFKSSANNASESFSYELSEYVSGYIKIEVTCSKGDSNAKSVAVNSLELIGSDYVTS